MAVLGVLKQRSKTKRIFGGIIRKLIMDEADLEKKKEKRKLKAVLSSSFSTVQ